MKPQYAAEIVEELKQLVPESQVLEQGREYRFGPVA
jgi:hypothetical protein